MKILKQIVRIVFGFFAATLAALLVSHFIPPLLPKGNAVPYVTMREFLLVASVDWLFIASGALVPVLIAVIIAEVFKLRSLTVHIAAGAIAGFLFTGHARNISSWLDLSAGPVLGVTESLVLIGAGTLGAIAYWWYAGKYAGSWREA